MSVCSVECIRLVKKESCTVGTCELELGLQEMDRCLAASCFAMSKLNWGKNVMEVFFRETCAVECCNFPKDFSDCDWPWVVWISVLLKGDEATLQDGLAAIFWKEVVCD